MHAGQKVPQRPEDDAPPLWLIRNDASARRISRSGGSLRTAIGYDTLLTGKVENIEIDEMLEIEVVAPYAPPKPQLALVIVGMSVGMMLGSQFQPPTALILASVIVTFGIVAGIVGLTTMPSQRLMRMKSKDGATYMVTYRTEDEDRVRGLFSHAKWEDGNITDDQASLRPHEERQAERMRIATALIASAVAMAMLVYALDTSEGVSDAVATGVNIFYLAVLVLTLMVAGISWYKMTRLGMKR